METPSDCSNTILAIAISLGGLFSVSEIVAAMPFVKANSVVQIIIYGLADIVKKIIALKTVSASPATLSSPVPVVENKVHLIPALPEVPEAQDAEDIEQPKV